MPWYFHLPVVSIHLVALQQRLLLLIRQQYMLRDQNVVCNVDKQLSLLELWFAIQDPILASHPKCTENNCHPCTTGISVSFPTRPILSSSFQKFCSGFMHYLQSLCSELPGDAVLHLTYTCCCILPEQDVRVEKTAIVQIANGPWNPVCNSFHENIQMYGKLTWELQTHAETNHANSALKYSNR